jgi:hypothetical protein
MKCIIQSKFRYEQKFYERARVSRNFVGCRRYTSYDLSGCNIDPTAIEKELWDIKYPALSI